MPDDETEVRTPPPPALQEKLLLPQVDDGRKKDSDRSLRRPLEIVLPVSARDLAASTLFDSNSGGAGGRPKNEVETLFESLRLLPPPPKTCAGKLSLRFLRLCLASLATFGSAPSDIFCRSGANDRPTDPTLSGNLLDVVPMGLPKTAAAPVQPYRDLDEPLLAGVACAASFSFRDDALFFRGVNDRRRCDWCRDDMETSPCENENDSGG